MKRVEVGRPVGHGKTLRPHTWNRGCGVEKGEKKGKKSEMWRIMWKRIRRCGLERRRRGEEEEDEEGGGGGGEKEKMIMMLMKMTERKEEEEDGK